MAEGGKEREGGRVWWITQWIQGCIPAVHGDDGKNGMLIDQNYFIITAVTTIYD